LQILDAAAFCFGKQSACVETIKQLCEHATFWSWHEKNMDGTKSPRHTHTNWTFEFLRLDPRKVCPIHGKESTGLSNVKKNSQISTSCLAHGETNRTVRATNRTKVPTCSN
jgi:hypothetical protein